MSDIQCITVDLRPNHLEKATSSMLVYQKKEALKVQFSELKSNNQTIGFVPTMGALHEGHLSLVRQALTENDVVVCSVFINPKQFNESSDFENYPKTFEVDRKLLESAGCQFLYTPSIEDVYENENELSIDIKRYEDKMEGAHRPGHFNGVIRVLTQLFLIVEPSKSYFGLKDYQQYLVVKELATQTGLGGEIIGCETIREFSGLAKSSRNQRLTKAQLIQATQIYKSFQMIKGANNFKDELNTQKKILSEWFDVEYLTLNDGETLEELNESNKINHLRVFFAGKIGNIRLIDNLRIK